jgi:hypothetical protein
MLKNQIPRSLPTSPAQQSVIRRLDGLRRTSLAIARWHSGGSPPYHRRLGRTAKAPVRSIPDQSNFCNSTILRHLPEVYKLAENS